MHPTIEHQTKLYLVQFWQLHLRRHRRRRDHRGVRRVLPPAGRQGAALAHRRGAARHADCRCADGLCLVLRPPPWLWPARRAAAPGGVAIAAPGVAGVADAGDHPGRYLRRGVHPDRGLGRGRGVRPGGGHAGVPAHQRAHDTLESGRILAQPPPPVAI